MSKKARQRGRRAARLSFKERNLILGALLTKTDGNLKGPWPVGLHKEIAGFTGLTPSRVYDFLFTVRKAAA